MPRQQPPDPWDIAADVISPPKADVFGMVGYEPTCKLRWAAREAGVAELPEPCGQCPQELFHLATEFDVLYGGAAGGGKTKALVMDDLRDAMYYPGIRIGAFRRTYDELAESLLKELQDISYAQVLGARWNGTTRELKFPNGSLIRYRYAETVADATRRQGGEYQKLTIDERNLILPEVVSVLQERLRSGRKELPVIGIRSGTNPGGPGHGAAKIRFIDATNYGERVVIDERGRSVRFIPSKVTDNPHVNVEYLTDLDSIPDPARRAAMRDGNWDTFAGQVFSEFNRVRHVVPAFKVPEEWKKRAGIDYGYAKPWAVVWIAEDNDGRIWVYRQLYKAGVGEKKQAISILAAEQLPMPEDAPKDADPEDYREVILTRAADPAMWAKINEANPIATTYEIEGCHVEKANNNRINGWQRIHTYLAEGPLCPIHKQMREEGDWLDDTCPMLHIFSTCEELIQAIPGAPYDPSRPEDVDTDYDHDHDLDALRYVLMSIGGEARFFFPSAPDEGPPDPGLGQELLVFGNRQQQLFGGTEYAYAGVPSQWGVK